MSGLESSIAETGRFLKTVFCRHPCGFGGVYQIFLDNPFKNAMASSLSATDREVNSSRHSA
ncbi:hypothetical protein D3Z50_22200 [Clostridiaceae bacterium]|nr:hypothetical protein [Clostridiaceae bacterium]